MAKTIVDILAAKKLLTLEESAAVRKEAKEKKVPLDEILYGRGISEQDAAEAKSALTGYPIKYLQGVQIPFDTLRDIPEESARHYKIIPLGRHEGYLNIGMLYPDDVASEEALKFVAGRANLPVKIFVITPSDFQSVLQEYRSLSGEVTKALGEFEKEYEALGEDVRIRKFDTTRIVEEAPVTKMMAVILRHAVEGMASDIHIEPTRTNLRVRFRVDGVLYTSLLLPIDVHPAVLTRIKVMTNLKIDETRVPQDGRFHAEIGSKSIDFRVSTFPTAFGEKVAIRILDPEAGIASFADLGLDGDGLVKLEEAIAKPYGLILITGPTGSGKSTTLYAILQRLNEERYNLMSLEDPIEYYIPGVNQSQVRPEIGYDFASGLRQILRQDPDVIMVGEVRDNETAGLAVQAALTGHVVLSTLHTNNSAGVIPRLIDMKVEPFLLPVSLNLMVAQRLVGLLCPDCKEAEEAPAAVEKVIKKALSDLAAEIQSEFKEPYKIYHSKGCPKCKGRGVMGRGALFEVFKMSPALEEIIASGPTIQKIMREAKSQGMITLRQDGVLKALQGKVSIEEVIRETEDM